MKKTIKFYLRKLNYSNSNVFKNSKNFVISLKIKYFTKYHNTIKELFQKLKTVKLHIF